MRINEETQSKMTVMTVKDWAGFQAALRALGRGRSLSRILLNGSLALVLAWPVLAGAEGLETSGAAMMDEVVVTATKTVEQRRDIASPVILFDQEAISTAPAENIGQLLADESGIDWRSRGNYGGAAQEIQIRGMDSDETLVLVNGQNINSPSLGRADLATIPLDSVERIEVVKGAGSLLYGSGAMAGTVNVFTKRPEREMMSLGASAGYGTDSTYRLSAEQGMYLAGDVGYYLTVGHSETDGERDNSWLTMNDLSLNLLLDKGEILDLSLFGSYVERSFGLPGIEPPAGTGDHLINGYRFYSGESASTLDHGRSNDGSLVMRLSSRPGPHYKISFKADYLYNRTRNSSRNNADSWTALAGTGLESRITNEVKGIEGNVELDPLAGLKLLFGADYRHQDWESVSKDLDEAGAALPGGTVNSNSLHTRGTFAEAQYRPAEQLKLFAGIRRENHSNFGHESVPRFGLVINPLAATALKINHGKFFKAPSPNDLFWPEDDYARGNPDLKAQTGWHSDATLEQGLMGERIFATLGYFDWEVDGKITWAENPAYPGPYGNKWTPTNLYSGEGSGWEAGLKIRVVRALTLALSYTRTKAREEIAPGQWRDAQYMARDRFKAKASWSGEAGTTATLVGRYVGERDYYRSAADTAPTDTLDAYFTADLALEQRLMEHWLVGVEVNNLLDEEYDTYLGSFVDSTGTRIYGGYPGGGRTLYVSAGYEY